MSPARTFSTLAEIVRNGYCLSCGLCTQVVEPGAVDMQFTRDDQLRPRARRTLSDAENARIVAVCPGVSVRGPFGRELANPDPVWGDIRATYEGWATDPGIRYRASAGGVMTAINRYLLESGRADFIVQVRPGGPDALTSEPVFVRDPEQLLTGAQSRYAPSAPLSAINAALATGEKFAVSLKPCDVAGVRNLQGTNPRAARQIVFATAMFCGTVPSRETSWKFLRRKGEDPQADPPSAFRWRGNGCPGATKATWADGREVSGTYNDLWNVERWTTQFRCKICPDAIGLQADIATGDFWPGGAPTKETPGENGIIAHTGIGAEVLGDCIGGGYLTVRDTDLETIAASQPHHVRLRQTFAARSAGATDGGLPMPSFHDLAAEACAAMLDQNDIAETRRGTRARVAAGQGDECTEF